MIKALITGGAGFQGSHLAEDLLKKNCRVTILNTPSRRAFLNAEVLTAASRKGKLQIVWGSILNTRLVDELVKRQEVVFHLAAKVNVDESLLDPVKVTRVNTIGTLCLLNAVTKHKKRLIFASTCEVYGDGHGKKKLREDSEFLPNSPYAASKAAADRLCHSYFRSFGTEVVIIRPFNVFGERQKSGQFGALIPILVSRAMKGQDLVVFGDGRQKRDFSYIADMTSMYNLALENRDLSGQTINFASGINTRIIDIADYIAKKFKVGVVSGPARPGEVSEFNADITRAHALGWQARTDIWEGIDRYITWIKANPRYS